MYQKDYKEVLNEVIEFYGMYGVDFDEENLRAQMKISKTMFSEKENATYPDIVQVLIGDYAKLFM